jgi:hypothetical protein
MRKISKALALAVIGGLGLAAGANAHAGWRWPTTTTTTTTTPTTTTVQTTTVATTTTVPTTTTTSTGSVQVISPLNGTPYSRGSSSLAIGDIRSTTGGVLCSISFGDGSPPVVVPASQVAVDDYRCSAGHVSLTLTGHLTIDIAATAADGTVVGESSIQVWVV